MELLPPVCCLCIAFDRKPCIDCVWALATLQACTPYPRACLLVCSLVLQHSLASSWASSSSVLTMYPTLCCCLISAAVCFTQPPCKMGGAAYVRDCDTCVWWWRPTCTGMGAHALRGWGVGGVLRYQDGPSCAAANSSWCACSCLHITAHRFVRLG